MLTHDKLEALFTPTVTALGYELWAVELITTGHSSVLRVYIDQEQGICVDDCAKVSRHLSSILDVEDPIAGEYTLEVSSPGCSRPLCKAEHFEQYLGELIVVKLRTALESRRKFKGVLKGFEANNCLITSGECDYKFSLDNIDKANLVPQF